MSVIYIHERDNVAVTLADLLQGDTVHGGEAEVILCENIERGHKVALKDIAPGEQIIKYGFPIGIATAPIHKGDWVHTHNMKTGLGDLLEYRYTPDQAGAAAADTCGKTFQGYRRASGKVGIRNEVWIVPTVSCVNRGAQLIARTAQERFGGTKNIDGIFEFTHPYGCSQLGEDHGSTQKILADLVNHPHAGAVLVLGLGCENNHVAEFKKVLGNYDPDRVRFLVAQDVEDEIEEGLRVMEELVQYAAGFEREECPASELVVGLKCGGSDGFSGITANPLVGAFSDRLIRCGGSTVLTEVPEMFGAETLLMNRALDEEIFGNIVTMINDFKRYFQSYNQPVYENPSPGNKKGGISTLEEKSLGCTQKGGCSAVVDVLGYGDTVRKRGLSLLNGPGNDMVACTALAAAGCHVILFTTGRGTPLGTSVPTVKIATNSDLFMRKQNWMDFNAGSLLEGKQMAVLTEELLNYVLEIASGRHTKAEQMGFREIAIFKNGVTL